MLFIRTTLLLGLGVLILPTDHDSQARVYAGAKTAVHWTSTFCDRNPETCVQGRQGWAVFVKKAEFGFKMALDLLNERDQPKTLTSAAPQSSSGHATSLPPLPAAPMKRTTDTLHAHDFEPAGRGKTAKSGG
jgi:Family of unknown function (DUF5330)